MKRQIGCIAYKTDIFTNSLAQLYACGLKNMVKGQRDERLVQ